jgi:hypothetical protein
MDINVLELKECPFCGNSDNFEFKFHMNYGHGDCGYEGLRLMCKSCTASKGNLFGYGSPTKGDYKTVINLWNKRD